MCSAYAAKNHGDVRRALELLRISAEVAEREASPEVLRKHVELAIIKTEPGVRGDTATGATKPAEMETGLVVQVPLFINEGEIIRIDTRTGQYVERVTK